MHRMTWTHGLVIGAVAIACGCASVQSPMPPAAGLKEFIAPPTLATLPAVAELPAPPSPANLSSAPLALDDVLQSVNQHFPLLFAAERERDIALGQRLAAEGQFDLNLRSRGTNQEGSFGNSRFDISLEQPIPQWGMTAFSGYRFGYGDFPVYYGDRKTADGGEFRTGVQIPLLRDRSIDRRRAILRQAQIGEPLALATVQTARLGAFRSGARAYWAWAAAGEQHRISAGLLKLAKDRQELFEKRTKLGADPEFIVIEGRRTVAEREGALIANERRLQQTSFDLSLLLRDASGNPVVPNASQLPTNFADTVPARFDPSRLAQDLIHAVARRPELMRFQLQKERLTVDLQLARNQQLPGLNAGIAATQDVGGGKKSFAGKDIFASDRTNAEVFLALDLPVQRRDAFGRTQVAQAQLMQVLAQERYARDVIVAEVQDVVSNLDRTYQRLLKAKEEVAVADEVAMLERKRFDLGTSTFLEVNLRELFAAGARAKVVDTLAEYQRALADLRAATGEDSFATP